MPEFQTVFIDNSSTCLALAERMNLAKGSKVSAAVKASQVILAVKK